MAARLHLISVALIFAIALAGGVAMQLELWQPGALWSAQTYSRMLAIHAIAWLPFGAPALAGCFGDLAVARLAGADPAPRGALAALPYVAFGLWVIGVAASVSASWQAEAEWSLYVPDSQQDPGLAATRQIGILAFAAAGVLHAARLGVAVWRARPTALRIAHAAVLVVAIVAAAVATLLELHAPSPGFVQATASFVALVLVIATLDPGDRLVPLIAIAFAALWAFTPLRVLGIGFVALAIVLAAGRPASATAHRPVALVLGLVPILLVQIGARTVLVWRSGDFALHDSQFVVGEHHALVAVLGLAWLASLQAWSATQLRRIPDPLLAWIGAGLASAGALLHVLASLWIGMRGMPRRYHDYDLAFRSGHMIAGVAAACALAGVAILVLAWLRGRPQHPVIQR